MLGEGTVTDYVNIFGFVGAGTSIRTLASGLRIEYLSTETNKMIDIIFFNDSAWDGLFVREVLCGVSQLPFNCMKELGLGNVFICI